MRWFPAKLGSMKLGISTKLFLGIFVTTLLVVTVLIVLIDLGFESGLLRLINEQEKGRIENLAAGLQKEVEQRGDLNYLRENHRDWVDLLDQYISERGARRKHQRGPRSHANGSAPDDKEYRKPPDGEKRDQRGSSDRPPPRHPPNRAEGGIERTISLFDAEKNRLIGRPERNDREVYLPIRITSGAEETTVAYLSYLPKRQIPQGLELDFAQA